MADPNWNDGFYYDGSPPHAGLKLARRKPPPPSRFSLPHFLLTVPDARGDVRISLLVSARPNQKSQR